MSRVSVSEYYDIFDVKRVNQTYTTPGVSTLPSEIVNTPMTNYPFGFRNEANAYTSQPEYFTANGGGGYTVASVTNKDKAPQAVSAIRVDSNGDIWCYPPNVSVPYWTKIIFRNYDYTVCPHKVDDGDGAGPTDSPYSTYIDTNYTTVIVKELDPYHTLGVDSHVPVPREWWGKDSTATAAAPAPWTGEDLSNDIGHLGNDVICDWKQVPLFLKFDQYQSRSKVVFSRCDKTRNPDIEFKFGYQHNQMEPIKLNLSLTANIPIRDTLHAATYYNENLTYKDIERLLSKCYWCIEWVYEPPIKE